MMNKYYNFDESWGISAVDIFSDARDKKKEAEEKLLEEQHHTEALDIVINMVYDFFRYLGFQGKNEDVMAFIDQAAAAERIYDSLGNADVPEWLKLEAIRSVRDDTAAAYNYADDPIEKDHYRIIASTMNKILNNTSNK